MPVASRTRSVMPAMTLNVVSRFQPVPVGPGGLAPAALTADLGPAVRVELLTEHDVIGEHDPIDPHAVVEPRRREQPVPVFGRLGGVGDERGRELRRHGHTPVHPGVTGRGATVTDGIERFAPPRNTVSITPTRCSTSMSEPLR